MAKIDLIKEHINALRGYLNIAAAIIIALGAGISKLYLSQNFGLLFWFGIFLIMLLLVIFVIISKGVHKNIQKLKDL